MDDHFQQYPQYQDAVHVAAQLGRLDFVSALLSIIGAILAILGVYAFFSIRKHAKIVAAEEAREIAKGVAEEAANSYMQENIHEIIEAYRDFILDGVDRQIADRIAKAQGNNEQD